MPPVVTCSALTLEGINEIWDIVLYHRENKKGTGEFDEKRKKQAVDWMWSLVEEGLKDQFYKIPDVRKMLPKLTKEVERGKTAPTAAAHELLSSFSNKRIKKKVGNDKRK